MRSLLRSKRGRKEKIKGEVKIPSRSEVRGMELDSKVEMIRSLIPLGLMAVSDVLEQELDKLTGTRYSRQGGEEGNVRYGKNPGSVYLGGQKVPFKVARVRNQLNNEEVALKSYHAFHNNKKEINEILLHRVFHGLSCRNYEAAAESIPGTFGLSSSSVSRRFIQASSAKLKEFNERDLSSHDIIAMFVDGKSFAEHQLILAVGVGIGGEKIPLGFIQASTENEKVISGLFSDLLSRGLYIEKGILIVIDGSKGIHKAVKKVLGKKSIIQRCQWHKRENIVSYLPKNKQKSMRRRLQHAYSRPTYKEAKNELLDIRKDLSNLNQSAMNSLDEGLEETLTLHNLGLFGVLGESLKTTNCIESINSMIEKKTGKISYWTNSNQIHRWFATALLDIEPRLRRIKGYKHLHKLREKFILLSKDDSNKNTEMRKNN